VLLLGLGDKVWRRGYPLGGADVILLGQSSRKWSTDRRLELDEAFNSVVSRLFGVDLKLRKFALQFCRLAYGVNFFWRKNGVARRKDCGSTGEKLKTLSSRQLDRQECVRLKRRRLRWK
jgi:hypothetical protein